MTPLAFLTEITWKGASILAAAFACGVFLRNASASFRHFVWTAAFAMMLVLPAGVLLMPKWGPAEPVVPAAQAVRAVTAAAITAAPVTPAAPARPAPNSLFWLWMAGAAGSALYFLAGALRTSWMVRRSSPASYAQAMIDDVARELSIRRPVRALENASAPMPLTWGALRPVVVLPEGAAAWPAERLRTVLLHELVHVQRFDVLAQSLAHGVCALNWFNPLCWMALRELRKERERACDDIVLLRGVSAPDYAEHLLGLVRAMSARRTPWAQAPAMAEASDLESRVRALLDRSRNRRPVSRLAAAAILTAVAIVTLPIAAITAHAQMTGGVVAGIVEDAAGARIPNCRVTARNSDGIHRETTRSNAAGEYSFASIPAGTYTLEFSSPGFAIAKLPLSVVSGAGQRLDAHLEIGQMNEQVTVIGQKAAAPQPAQPTVTSRQRIKIGGSVQPAKLVRQPHPIYPDALKAAGITGTVTIRAVISTEGEILNPQVVNTVDPGLAQAALDSVRQWRYQPSRLNGEPVEVTTTIDIVFELSQ